MNTPVKTAKMGQNNANQGVMGALRSLAQRAVDFLEKFADETEITPQNSHKFTWVRNGLDPRKDELAVFINKLKGESTHSTWTRYAKWARKYSLGSPRARDEVEVKKLMAAGYVGLYKRNITIKGG